MEPLCATSKASKPPAAGAAPVAGWRRFAVALSCATVLYGTLVRVSSNPRNRMHQFWTVEDGLAYVLGMVLLALAIVLFRCLGSRSRMGALADHAFWLVIILSLPPALIAVRPESAFYFWGLLIPAVTLLGISFFQPSRGIVPRLEKAALLISPFFAIVAIQVLGYPAWGTPRETLAMRFPERPAHPVFVFIFDEWSYRRSVQNGEFIPRLKNLRSLAGQSYTFDQTESLGRHTWPSLVRFIYQTTDELSVDKNSGYWRGRSGVSEPTTERPSLFKLAREHGYNTALVGFYIPQRKILGDQVDYVDTRSIQLTGETLPEKIRLTLTASFEATKEWWIRKKTGGKAAPDPAHSLPPNIAMSNLARNLVAHIGGESLAMIRNLPENAFLFSHIQLPHGPFIFDEEGNYIGPFRGERMPFDPEGYMRQVGYVDTLVGSYVSEIKKAGKFDEALIVITSDHAYRADPGESDIHHVPLLVKLPYQKEAVQVRGKFSLGAMKPLFGAVMAGRLDEARAVLNAASASPGE